MTVRDIELSVLKIRGQLGDHVRVGDDPQAVGHVVAVGELRVGIVLRAILQRLLGGVLFVHVERVDLAEIAVGRLHQIKAVGFRF